MRLLNNYDSNIINYFFYLKIEIYIIIKLLMYKYITYKFFHNILLYMYMLKVYIKL